MTLLKDGGIGTALLSQKPPELAVCDLLNAYQPEAVLDMHWAFLDAGARLLTSNTFCCDEDSLAGTSWAGKGEALSRLGAELARSVAGQHTAVAGSLGPGWRRPGEQSLDAIADSYAARARGLIAGGADWLWIETIRDPDRAEAAVAGCRRSLLESGRDLPIALLVSLDDADTIGGAPAPDVLERLEALPVDLLGINCSQGPTSTHHALAYLTAHSSKSLACCPNAGSGPGHYASAQTFAAAMRFIQTAYAPAIIGGCCGAGPEHIRALGKAIGNRQ